MSELTNLQPKDLWTNFSNICAIPHPSKKEAKIIEFVKSFGEDLGLKTIVDEIGNVIIKKPATQGMENKQGIILQAHLDMVPQANSDKDHDFEKDPIEAYIDGEWVTANGTTLGADNGMGVAAAMAVLQSNEIQHGPIEALFTVDEETGMTGAFNLKAGLLDGDILLNMDSEDEGELYVGCAGGMDANVSYKYNEESAPADHCSYKVEISGLKGGHSGLDIHLGRGNANILLARYLKYAISKFNVKINNINGGSLRNAIPREIFANMVVPSAHCDDFENSIKEFEKQYINELGNVEPNLKFVAEKSDNFDTVIDKDSVWNIINAVYACPNGVIRMSDTMPGVVETSTNLAIFKTINGKFEIKCLMRSSVDSAKHDTAQKIHSTFKFIDANVEFDGEYPGWKPNPDSAILKTMSNIYKEKFNKTPDVKVIHAGLECGILGATYTNWDMISFGPTIRFPHSPDEKVNIETVEKFWVFLLETLKNAPEK